MVSHQPPVAGRLAGKVAIVTGGSMGRNVANCHCYVPKFRFKMRLTKETMR